MDLNKEALDYHALPRPGKIELGLTKPCATQRDLSLAYTPGVAVPCLEIQKDESASYQYTSRGNLVAVISNGTAVLGLGDIGAAAGKPVMEGKGVLFKRFAGIDVFDLEVKTHDPDEFIELVANLEPTFGGINLEDIKAPECFKIEQALIERMNIPVFHDDQHGTAIISGAALVNGCVLLDKKLEDIRIVVCGAGAAGIACAKFYVALGAKRENVWLVDSKGVVTTKRDDLTPEKAEFAVDTKAKLLADAVKGADVFAGLSRAGLLTGEMVKTMANSPMIFAMANPTPEIFPDEVRAVRSDAIIATGRSDFPNQVNNVLGFPFIFRGALDVRARKINEEMKLAASRALARLTREDVPDVVLRAYGLQTLRFGRDYIIPKPFDPRVLTWEASAVAEAAASSGVARMPIESVEDYRESLIASRSHGQEFLSQIRHKARDQEKRIIFPDGEHDTIIRAVHILREERLVSPVLVGNVERIHTRALELGVRLEGATIIDPLAHEDIESLAKHLYEKRKRKGLTWADALYYAARPDWFASLMVDLGHVDGLVAGISRSHPFVMQAILQVIPLRKGVERVSGMFIVLTRDRLYFLADCTAQIDPTAQHLAETAIFTANVARRFSQREVKVAMLSYSNFGTVQTPQTEKIRKAIELVRQAQPDLCIDGEMQADTAISPTIQARSFPFCELGGRANVLIFPDLASGNITSKLLQHIGGLEAIGPLTLGLSKPVNVLHPSCDVEDVVNAAAMTVIECLEGVM
ncbi:MAG: NADP-dependent malic enzyme [Phycisphaerales bacterium]|nr:NADP-dependent malic enzyme [Phycisphaerales bacterium]MCB9862704.1 NADP-dependent malic enzyme [Phycisphaerales bacterium]